MYMTDMARDSNRAAITETWRLKHCKHAPKQLNDYDCGMFTIM
jgi:Ulp1 family protease